MESSFHSLTPILPLFCSSQFQRLHTIQFLCSQAHIPAGWHPKTRLFPSWLLLFSTFLAAEHFFIITSHRPHRKHCLILLRRRVLIHCLAMDVLFLYGMARAGMYFPSRCLAIFIQVKVKLSLCLTN
jgi:hypothetical protein